jgi:polygalacturonase
MSHPTRLLYLIAALSFGLSARAQVPPATPPPMISVAPPTTPVKQFNVRTYGATGDGETKDTAALQRAIDTCTATGGGEVVIPAGNYVTGSLVLGNNTVLRLEKDSYLLGSPDAEDYPLETVRFEGAAAQGHRALVSATKADHIGIVGPGSLVNFRPLGNLRNPRGPVMIEFTECTNVRLEDFTNRYVRLWSIHLLNCTDVVVRGIFIRSTETNGDGIDVDSTKNLRIENVDIDAGDDAISLKSGRGLLAQQTFRPTENVLIRNSILHSSRFAAIGLGTEMSGGLRNIRIENSTLSGVENGIYIKSRDGRGGFIDGVTFVNDTFEPSPTMVGIDLMTKGIQAVDPVPGTPDKWARVANITFSNITLHNVNAIIVGNNISPERPLTGLTLNLISGTANRGITLSNVVDAKFSNITVTGYTGELFNLTNVTGTGLGNPAPQEQPAAQAETPAK